MLHVIPKTYRTFRFSAHFTNYNCFTEIIFFHTQDAHNGTIDISQPWTDVPFLKLIKIVESGDGVGFS